MNNAIVKILDLSQIQENRRENKPCHPYPWYFTCFYLFSMMSRVYESIMEADCTLLLRGIKGTIIPLLVLSMRLVIHKWRYWWTTWSNTRQQCNKGRFWNDLEAREINELILFCTGDASPSYFLHSACQLSGDLINRLSNRKDTAPAPQGRLCFMCTDIHHLMFTCHSFARNDHM